MKTELAFALLLVALPACDDPREVVAGLGLWSSGGVLGVDPRRVPPSCGEGEPIVAGPDGVLGCGAKFVPLDAIDPALAELERSIEAVSARLAALDRPSPPPTLSLAASTCAVTTSGLSAGQVIQDGPWIRWTRRTTPLTVVCPVPALAEDVPWNRLEAIVDDPDGAAPGTSVEVSLRYVTEGAPGHVATIAANAAPSPGPTTVAVAFAPGLALADRGHYVEIRLLTNGSGTPGVAGIRLRAD